MHNHSPRSAKLGGFRSAAALSVTALMALAPAGLGYRSKVGGTAAEGGGRAADPSALAARTVFLNESAHLHLTSKHGFTLNEEGSASGTVTGAIYVHLTLTSSTRVTAEVDIYPRGGSISGNGEASYHRAATTASFSGSMSIDRGTGSYDHVHGSGLSFSGMIQESKDDVITVHVSGSVSD